MSITVKAGGYETVLEEQQNFIKIGFLFIYLFYQLWNYELRKYFTRAVHCFSVDIFWRERQTSLMATETEGVNCSRRESEWLVQFQDEFPSGTPERPVSRVGANYVVCIWILGPYCINIKNILEILLPFFFLLFISFYF